MAFHESEAIVLKIFDYGESDKIIVFLTADFGKITAIAKGAKRSKIRFVRKLELFTRLNIRFADNKHSDMVRVDEAELLAPYPTLSKDYERFLCANLVCELLLNWATADRETNLFHLAVWTLTSIAHNNPLTSLLLFQLHLLTLLGFHLHLSSCTACDTTMQEGGSFEFVAENNGIICTDCLKKTKEEIDSTPLSIGSLKLLEKGREITPERWSRFHFTKSSLQEVTRLFKSHNHYLLQRDIITWNHLEEYLRQCKRL
jgi:DNA repair protein RecO (recombination protein O)